MESEKIFCENCPNRKGNDQAFHGTSNLIFCDPDLVNYLKFEDGDINIERMDGLPRQIILEAAKKCTGPIIHEDKRGNQKGLRAKRRINPLIRECAVSLDINLDDRSPTAVTEFANGETHRYV
jgi:hypothetical protein